MFFSAVEVTIVFIEHVVEFSSLVALSGPPSKHNVQRVGEKCLYKQYNGLMRQRGVHD